jgi:hypothetical protein
MVPIYESIKRALKNDQAKEKRRLKYVRLMILQTLIIACI